MTKYTKADIGFVPFSEPNRDPQKYYEGIIKWAYDTHEFVPDYDHDFYPQFMWEQPMFEFPESENEHLYADFIDTTNFMNKELCDEGVCFAFVNGELTLILDKE